MESVPCGSSVPAEPSGAFPALLPDHQESLSAWKCRVAQSLARRRSRLFALSALWAEPWGLRSGRTLDGPFQQISRGSGQLCSCLSEAPVHPSTNHCSFGTTDEWSRFSAPKQLWTGSENCINWINSKVTLNPRLGCFPSLGMPSSFGPEVKGQP